MYIDFITTKMKHHLSYFSCTVTLFSPGNKLCCIILFYYLCKVALKQSVL